MAHSPNLRPAAPLVAVALLALLRAVVAINVTTLAPSGKLVDCGGYNELRLRYFARPSNGWLYVTDTDCNAKTGLPCKPSANTALAPLTCLNVPSCRRETSKRFDVPLCVVVINMNDTLSMDIELDVTGTFDSSSQSSNDDSGLSNFEIMLICVCGGCGAIALAALAIWASAYCCCRRPEAPTVTPHPPPDDMAAFATKSLAATPPQAPGMGPQLMSGTLTLLPPPSMGYPDASKPGLPPPSPYMVRTPYGPGVPPPYGPGVPPPYGVVPGTPGGGQRAASLAPLPATAYGAMSPTQGVMRPSLPPAEPPVPPPAGPEAPGPAGGAARHPPPLVIPPMPSGPPP